MDEEGVGKGGVPPWFLWTCLIPRYSKPSRWLREEERERKGSRLHPSLPPPCSRPVLLT